MAKIKFSLSKMLKDGQVVDLVDNWTANLKAKLEAADYGDTEPYMEPTIHASVFRGERSMAQLVASEGIIFPKSLASKVREPLVKVINEALDFLEEADLDTVYHKMKKKGTWPPPPETWIKKEAPW